MTRKKTNKEFLQELKDKNINAIPIEEYKSYHEKIKVKFDCGHDNFSYVKENDEIKNNYCKNKKIPLLRIPYWWIRNDKAERELDAFIKNLNDYRNTERA